MLDDASSMPPLADELTASAVYPSAPSMLSDVTCEPTSPATCLPCFDEDLDQTFCSTTGFKREVKCVYKTAVADNASTAGTDLVLPREPYLAFQGCSPEPTNAFAAVVKFELTMALLFAISFSFQTKRKNKMLAIQHHRIAQYLG